MAYTATFQGTAALEYVDVVRKALVILARESRKEPGTIRYEFYQLEDDPTNFLLFAIWENEAAWQAHVAGDAHARHVASLPEGAWAKRPVMTRLSALEEID
jgi:quinol monooxygenase YgiN